MPHLTLYLSDKELNAVDREAKKNWQGRSTVIRAAIRMLLDVKPEQRELK